MSVDGGYGLMFQVPQGFIQQAIKTYYNLNAQQFSKSITRQFPVPQYGFEFDIGLSVTLAEPNIHLGIDRTLQLDLGVQASAQLHTRIDALPGGGLQPPSPELILVLNGSVTVEVQGVFKDNGDKKFLFADLESLQVTNFSLQLNSATFNASQDTLTLISSIARRTAVLALTQQVKGIPVSWDFKPAIPSLNIPSTHVELDYKIVSDGTNLALALLIRVNQNPVDWNAVSYAIELPTDIGIFMDLGLLNSAFQLIDASLEHYSLPVADLYSYDVQLHVQPNAFIIDSLKIQSKTIQTVTDIVTTTVCDGIDPCHLICRNVAKEITHVIQLDEVFEVHGSFTPYVEANHIRVHTDNIDVHISYTWQAILFTATDSLLPLGGIISAVLIVMGEALLDKTADGFVNNLDGLDLLIDQPITGTNLRLRASPRNITWPTGTFALMGNVSLGDA